MLWFLSDFWAFFWKSLYSHKIYEVWPKVWQNVTGMTILVLFFCGVIKRMTKCTGNFLLSHQMRVVWPKVQEKCDRNEGNFFLSPQNVLQCDQKFDKMWQGWVTTPSEIWDLGKKSQCSMTKSLSNLWQGRGTTPSETRRWVEALVRCPKGGCGQVGYCDEENRRMMIQIWEDIMMMYCRAQGRGQGMSVEDLDRRGIFSEKSRGRRRTARTKEDKEGVKLLRASSRVWGCRGKDEGGGGD